MPASCRFADDRYELRHDALAARIAESRSTVDLAFLEAVKLIKDRTKAFKSTGTYLSEGEISFIKAFDKRMGEEGGLSEEEEAYVRASIRESRRKRRRRNQQLAAVGTVLLIGFITSMSLWLTSRTSQFQMWMTEGESAYDANDYIGAITAYENAIEVKDREAARVALEDATGKGSHLSGLHYTRRPGRRLDNDGG